MLSTARLIVYFMEGLAVTVAIYLITKRQLRVVEIATLALTISVTFMILDLFAPGVAQGARQGSGFGLGFGQFGGSPTPMPRQYYEPVVEGMDDPAAMGYYSRWNPNYRPASTAPVSTEGPTALVVAGPEVVKEAQVKVEEVPTEAVRSASSVQRTGAFYNGSETAVPTEITATGETIYSPLKPAYGYRHNAPANWDALEQEGKKMA